MGVGLVWVFGFEGVRVAVFFVLLGRKSYYFRMGINVCENGGLEILCGI